MLYIIKQLRDYDKNLTSGLFKFMISAISW